MKAKFGAIVVAGSGKINGFVASRNRAGAYFRTKVTPVNPQTGAQSIVRNRLTSLSQAWRGLTQAVRDGFNSAVADYAKTDIFGDLKNPSGFNLWQRLNNNLLAVGSAILTEVPNAGSVFGFTTLSATADASDSSLTLTFTNAIPVGSAVKVFATPPVSAGKSFVKSEYRMIDVLTSSDTSPADVGAAWEAKFGNLVAGQVIFVKLVAVNTATGQEGIPLSAKAVVAA